MEAIGISWWALKITFGCLPGMCLVVYMFQCGFDHTIPRIPGLLLLWHEMREARKKGIRATAEIFLPRWAFWGMLLIELVLLLIPGDLGMVLSFNLSAIPSCVFAYHIGRKSGASKTFREQWELSKKYPIDSGDQIDIIGLFASRALLIFLFWALLSALLLLLAYVIGIWTPHYSA